MSEPNHSRDPALLTRAHVAPLAVFLGFMVVLMLVVSQIGWDHPDAPWWRRNPAHFIYPLQSLVVMALIIRYWKCYDFNWSWKWSAVAVVSGAVGIGFWLLPTVMYDRLGLTENPQGWMKWLGVDSRLTGFNPGDFSDPLAYGTVVGLRMFRAVVVVAFAEEVLWRGFLMRFVADWEGDYWKQPFGKASWKSYGIVTGLFMAAHAPVDYAAAFVYGSLTYALCVWSKNLGACVVMHATANLLMGVFIMHYGKYGLW